MMRLAEQLQPSRLTALPPRLYETTRTAHFPQVAVIHMNPPLLAQLGLVQQHFAGDDHLSHLQAISTVYAGHQFGIYTSKLGDGRVHILGDLTTVGGERLEIQLKGAGATPFARGNNGRMQLSEAITEYLGCEAMAGLGIASTRGLALIQHVPENDAGDENEAILVRMAPTHLRFGHFEYLHNQQDLDLLKQLVEHVIAEYYPDLLVLKGSERYLYFLYSVTQRTADLVARWQAAGFVHSVMNTDNMSIIGLTLDYGVFGFMPEYDPAYCPNSNDDQHRYAFDQQVEVARWNCMALAEALQELLPDKRIPANLLRHYRKVYSDTWNMLMRKKLGLCAIHSDDNKLVADLLDLLTQQGTDYTRFFRQLSYLHRFEDEARISDSPLLTKAFRPWLDVYRQRLQLECTSPMEREQLMLSHNPKYILRKESLEQVLLHAEQAQDFSALNELLYVLQSPYDEHPTYEYLA